MLTVHTVRCKGKKGRRDTEREKFLRDKKKDKEKVSERNEKRKSGK